MALDCISSDLKSPIAERPRSRVLFTIRKHVGEDELNKSEECDRIGWLPAFGMGFLFLSPLLFVMAGIVPGWERQPTSSWVERIFFADVTVPAVVWVFYINATLALSIYRVSSLSAK